MSTVTSNDLAGTTAIVTGASRGFGRGIARALVRAGAIVVGVARDGVELADVRAELGSSFTAVVADATDPIVAGQLIETYPPRTLVLNAGARPLARPLHEHTWQTFSRNWDVDVQHVFHWSREALLRPLAPGSVIVAVSSGAADAGPGRQRGHSAGHRAGSRRHRLPTHHSRARQRRVTVPNSRRQP